MPSGKKARQQRQEAAAAPPPVRSKGGPGGARQASGRTLAIAGGVILLVIVAVVLAIVLTQSSSGGDDGRRKRRRPDDQRSCRERRQPGTPPSSALYNATLRRVGPSRESRRSGFVLGDPNAPVTLVEYIDLQCPVCAEFETTAAAHAHREVRPAGEAEDQDAAVEHPRRGPRQRRLPPRPEGHDRRRLPEQGLQLLPGPVLEPGQSRAPAG